MAPRRSGSDGGSSYSDSSDSSAMLWIEDTVLLGSNFHDRYTLAQFIIQVICLFALVVIAIAAMTIKKRSPSVRALFRWFRFGTAMTMALAYSIYALIYTILWEKQAVVVVVFHLISSIIHSIAYVADIFVLITIFALLTQLNKRIALSNFLAKAPFVWTYSIVCAILFALYVAGLALRIQYQVEVTQNGFYSIYTPYSFYLNYEHYLQILHTAAKVTIAYYALYTGSSIVILVLAITTSMRLLKEQNAQQKLMAIFLVALVAFPLLFRSVIELAFVAAYSLDSYSHESQSGALAEAFFYYFCTAVTFAGIVAIAFLLARDVPEQEPTMYASPELVMSPNLNPYGGNGVVAAMGHQNYVQGWNNKQPQATQQQVSPYYEQSSMPNGGAQPHNYSTYGDSRTSMQPQPGMNGQVAPHGVYGYGQSPEVVSTQPQPGMNGQVAPHGVNGYGHSPEVTPVSPIR